MSERAIIRDVVVLVKNGGDLCSWGEVDVYFGIFRADEESVFDASGMFFRDCHFVRLIPKNSRGMDRCHVIFR